MGNQHLDPLFAKILDAVTAPRSVRQLEIEQKIDAHRPDFSEAVELLHAIEAALRARYDHAMLDDVAHYFLYTRKALERAELHGTQPYAGSADYHNDDPDRE